MTKIYPIFIDFSISLSDKNLKQSLSRCHNDIYFQSIVSDCKSVQDSLGLFSPESLSLINDIGILSCVRLDITGSLQLLKFSSQACESTLGISNILTINSIFNYGVAKLINYDFQESSDLFYRLINICENSCLDISNIYLFSNFCQGSSLAELDKHLLAYNHFSKVRESFKSTFGYDSRFSLAIDVACFSSSVLNGNNDDIKFVESACSKTLKKFGLNHPDSTQALYSFGNSLLKLNDPNAALEQFIKTTESGKKSLNENHPLVLRSLAGQGICHRILQNFKLSVDHLLVSSDLLKNTLSESHFITNSVINELLNSQFVYFNSFFSNSTKWFPLRSLPSNDVILKRSFTNVNPFEFSFDFNFDFSIINRAEKIFKHTQLNYSENSFEYLSSLRDLASSYLISSQFLKAIDLFTSVNDISNNIFSHGDVNIPKNMANLGIAFAASKNFELAKNIFQKSLDILKLSLPPTDPDIIEILLCFVRTLVLSEQIDDAKKILDNTFLSFNDNEVKETDSFLSLANVAGHVSFILKLYKESLDYFTKCLHISTILYGEKNPITSIARRNALHIFQICQHLNLIQL